MRSPGAGAGMPPGVAPEMPGPDPRQRAPDAERPPAPCPGGPGGAPARGMRRLERSGVGGPAGGPPPPRSPGPHGGGPPGRGPRQDRPPGGPGGGSPRPRSLGAPLRRHRPAPAERRGPGLPLLRQRRRAGGGRRPLGAVARLPRVVSGRSLHGIDHLPPHQGRREGGDDRPGRRPGRDRQPVPGAPRLPGRPRLPHWGRDLVDDGGPLAPEGPAPGGGGGLPGEAPRASTRWGSSPW